jgi:hypothetical protein
MPAVNGVGEPCAGEPHARFEVAGTGNGADLAKVTGVAQPSGKPAATKAPGPTASKSPRQSPTLHLEYEHFPDSLVFLDDCDLIPARSLVFDEFPDHDSPPYALGNRNSLTIDKFLKRLDGLNREVDRQPNKTTLRAGVLWAFGIGLVRGGCHLIHLPHMDGWSGGYPL